MSIPLGLTLLALQLLSPASAVPADSLPDAYLDAPARSIVERARERRSSVEGRIERYTTLSRSRVTVGFRALGRDRTLYRCEAAARVNWQRGDTIRVELLGAREVTPMFSGRVRAGDGDCGGASFDPTAERLGLAFGGGMSMTDSTFLRHPLAEGSERDYRFRSGGSTAMRLADGTIIRLRELEVLPRRSEPELVSGSLWLEDRSYAVVRAVLRMARPFDFDRDHERLDDEEDDEEDVPRILRPLRAEMRYMSIEYGLWEQEWWLPRVIAFEGEGQAGRLLGVPVRMERSYGDYQVQAYPVDAAVPPLPELPADSVCQGTDEDEADSVDVRVTVGSEGGSVRRRHRHDCTCIEGRCQVVVTTAVVDSLELVESPHLPGSIFSDDAGPIDDREMEQILARVAQIRRPPWQLAPVTWRTGLQGLDLVRYNRVEGLSLGAAANVELGGASLDATLRMGIADLAPNFDLVASRTSAFSLQRVAVYRRLDAVGPGPSSGSFGSSVSALLFGRDDSDYYRSWGVEITRQPAVGHAGLSWRLFGELQRPAAKHTDFSVAHAAGGDGFRDNILADDAEQLGLEVRLRGEQGRDPLGWRGWVTAGGVGSTGTFSFVQPRLTLGGTAPLPAGMLAGLELDAGSTFGEGPFQSRHFLGGGRTVRGYGGNAANGESFWTARAEVATAGPGARIVVFSDAGWAGPVEAISADPVLLSAGAGVSFLDGLLRIDAARPLREVGGYDSWRAEMRVDAGL